MSYLLLERQTVTLSELKVALKITEHNSETWSVV